MHVPRCQATIKSCRRSKMVGLLARLTPHGEIRPVTAHMLGHGGSSAAMSPGDDVPGSGDPLDAGPG